MKPEITLPAPPTAPRGQWHPVTINDFAALRALSLIPNLARLGAADRFPEELLFRSVKPHRRDPNSFYFKPERPSRPVKDFSIECEQWRHGIAPEEFFGLISFDNDVGSVSGAIECEIHAENISTPVKSTFPVKIEVRQGDTKAYAEDLISRL
mgnify:CR=1 FL=1